MKEYIEYNTRQRAQASSKFEIEFYKLMNNRYIHFFNLFTLKFQTFFDSFLHIEKFLSFFNLGQFFTS